MRSWEPPTEQTIRTALQRIRSPDFEAYFFAKLKNPTWIAPLAARGVFSSPPEPVDSADNGTIFPSWQASKYLVRMAPHAPSEVVSVLEQLDTRNPNVAGDIIQAALAVPVEFASRLVPSIVRAAQAHEPSFHYSQAAGLCARLADGNQVPSALSLCEGLFYRLQDGSAEASRGRDSRRLKALEVVVEPLARSSGAEFLASLSQLLTVALLELPHFSGQVRTAEP